MINKKKIFYILTSLLIWFWGITGVYAIDVEQEADVVIPIKEERFNSESSILSDKRLMASSSYDMRKDITVRVKNQKSSASCWTFSTLSVLETNLALTQKSYIDFSERHMNYATSKTFLNGINPLGYEREVNSGGNPIIGLSYMTRGSGPVLEADMPFSEVENKINLSEIEGKKVAKKIEEYVMFPTILKEKQTDGSVVYKDGNSEQTYTKEQMAQVRKNIKEHLMKYGSLTAMTISGSAYSQYYNYNLEYPAYYCDDKNLEPNHQVSIIGWDDNYPVSNFNSAHRPSEPGAYLVLNSYGTGGSYPQGCYYISYDDVWVEGTMVGITKVSDVDYDHIYQTDPLGPSTQIRMGDESTLYGANVFTKSGNKREQINQISIASFESTKCEVYINPTDGDLSSSKLQSVSGIVSLKEGYNTIKLDKPVEITGDKFAVVIKCTNDDTVHLTIEAPASTEFWATATSQAGESFVSKDAISWVDLASTDVKNANLCIKAFTEEIGNDIISNKYEYEIDEDNHSISKIHPTTDIQNFLNNFKESGSVKIYNESNQEVNTNQYIATGMRLVINGEQSYEMVVNGDLNGDGYVDITDLVKIKLHILGKKSLKDAYLLAADTNNNGGTAITVGDMGRIIFHVFDIKKIYE